MGAVEQALLREAGPGFKYQISQLAVWSQASAISPTPIPYTRASGFYLDTEVLEFWNSSAYPWLFRNEPHQTTAGV